MKRVLQLYFGAVLLTTLLVTGWATGHESVFVGGAKLLREPWGIATLFDTYFAFFAFYLWVHLREKSNFARFAWFVAICLLGNIAMATYALLALNKTGWRASLPLGEPSK